MTDDGFGALMCQKCAQSQIRLEECGGGDTIGGGGGSANREPGSFIRDPKALSTDRDSEGLRTSL